MSLKDMVLYKNEEYILYIHEGNAVFHPSIFDVIKVWSTSEFDYESKLIIDEFTLKVDSFKVRADGSYPDIKDISPVQVKQPDGEYYMEYQDIKANLDYTGAAVIVNGFICDYGYDANLPLYCYQKVIELVFNNGVLITTIDHSRAMLKIRKNIDAGFRTPKIKKDDRCINGFIKSSLVGDYPKKKIRKDKFKWLKKIDITKQKSL